MKKRLSFLLCMVLAMMMLTACGRKKAAEKVEVVPTETPAPTATVTPTPVPTEAPTPAPTPTAAPVSTPIPTQRPSQSSLPKVTKDPASVTVQANGSCTFITQCEDATLTEWHFLSPDGSLDVGYQAVQTQFPALKITGGNTKELALDGIPEMFNGVKVYCKCGNSVGSVNTALALITVKPNEPTVLHHGFVGNWVDEATGLCQVNISYKTEGSVNVNVCWSNSAWQRSHWQMMAYVYQDGIMVYDSCHFWIETGVYGPDYTITSESYDGTGSFYVKDGKLHWYNDVTGQLTVLIPA